MWIYLLGKPLRSRICRLISVKLNFPMLSQLQRSPGRWVIGDCDTDVGNTTSPQLKVPFIF